MSERTAHGFPAELLAQLSVTHRNDPLLLVLNKCGGRADYDNLLIGMYRELGIVSKRSIVTNRMSRLKQAGLCQQVERGVYEITESGRAKLASVEA